MLHLRFSTILSGGMTVGPATAYFLVGGALVEHPTGRRIAHLVDHQWKIDDRYFLRIDCEGALPLEVRFVGPHPPRQRTVGPFARGHAADGMIYADDRPIARYLDAHDRWLCVQDGQQWPVITLGTPRAPSASP